MLNQEFLMSSKTDQVKYIVDLISNNGENPDIDKLKKVYESEHGACFIFDKKRYEYAFLSGVDLYQAIILYDNLVSDSQFDMIKIIKLDHKHLLKLVDIHEAVQDINTVKNILYHEMSNAFS